MLGGGIDNIAGRRDETCKRGGIDNMSKALVYHYLIGCMNTIDYAV